MIKDLNFLKDIKIAHRGLCSSGLIENSMSSFKECVENNISIELDVRILKDNTLVVFHDNDAERMTGDKIILDKVCYNDIKSLRLKNTGENIPTLKEVLELVDGKVLLDIELKCERINSRICEEVCKLLDIYRGKFIIKSFNSYVMFWFKKYRPNYIRGLLYSNIGRIWKVKKLIDISFVKLVNPDFVVFNYKYLPNRVIDKLYSRGVPVLLYTIKGDCYNENKYTGIIYEGK
jgi:glycerophosphoryl diester phosphodiesterase